VSSLHHEVAGDGAAVVLLHAGVCDSRMWEPNRASLGDGRRLVIPDLRGFGRSEWGTGPYSHVDDVIDLLDRLGIEQAAFAGASFGGRVAIDVALEHPSRVTALLLAAPALGGWDWSAEVRAFGEREDELLDGGDVPGAVELNLRMWVDGPARGPSDVDRALRGFVGEMQRRAFELALEAFAAEPFPGPERALDPPAAGRLGAIRVPTLVAVGELDVQDMRSIAAAVAGGVQGGRLEVIAAAAHLPSLERPDVFDELAAGFLRDASL
jgi:pimeloyl-ACP methyl ester carboxylesterase